MKLFFLFLVTVLCSALPACAGSAAGIDLSDHFCQVDKPHAQMRSHDELCGSADAKTNECHARWLEEEKERDAYNKSVDDCERLRRSNPDRPSTKASVKSSAGSDSKSDDSITRRRPSIPAISEDAIRAAKQDAGNSASAEQNKASAAGAINQHVRNEDERRTVHQAQRQLEQRVNDTATGAWSYKQYKLTVRITGSSLRVTNGSGQAIFVGEKGDRAYVGRNIRYSEQCGEYSYDSFAILADDAASLKIYTSSEPQEFNTRTCERRGLVSSTMTLSNEDR